MVPWIQVYSNLHTHPKTGRLVDELGIKSADADPEVVAVGLLVCLWSWAAQNAHDGDLSGVSYRTIANAARWKKAPDKLVKALQTCGFLDGDMKLHDWEEYAELYINRIDYQKEQNRRRVQEHRERKKAELGIKVCSYCGRQATGFDHIIPQSKGGTDEPQNLTPCCKRCNSSKNARDLADFLNNTSINLDLDSILQNDKLMAHVKYDEFGHFVMLQNL